MMNQRGSNVGGIESFFQKALDQTILFFERATGQGGSQLTQEHIRARIFDFRLIRNASALDLHPSEPLDMLNLKQLAPGHERNSQPAAPCPARSSNAMHVIFSVVRQIVIEHDLHVI